MNTKNKQSGAVSLFIVIFTMLLLTIITLSFIRIMLSDQRQATASDLSQSAYDSAQAGVEDAKRAILFYQSECASGDALRCSTALALINSTTCNEALSKVIDYVPGKEVLVQQSAGDSALQQAYTCVKITRQTDDYLGMLNQNDSKIIPLVSTKPFDTVHLEWFSVKDLQGTSTAVDVPNFSPTGVPPLVTQADWSSTANPRPPVMRTQLMQFGSNGFNLSDFDGSTPTDSNANTLFLYPTNIFDTPKTFASNTRKAPATSAPTQITCQNNLSGAVGYACSATLILPAPINGGNRTAFLRLSALYNKANYRVTLLNAGSPVQFDGVQPKVDSTGRANDLFRRIESRVEVIDATFPYPDAAVDSTDTLCKDFLITNVASDYKNNCPLP